jgi:hypothetical protein
MPQQVSSETGATVDDTCTLSGMAVAGAKYEYAGACFTADLVTPTNSSYFYRLPGPDGVCDSSDDALTANGSAAPSAVHGEAGNIATLDFPILGNNLIWGIEDPTYTVRTLAESGGAASALISGTTNGTSRT